MITLGIDLGTTNSLVAYLTENGPQIIPNALESNLTPSVRNYFTKASRVLINLL